MLSACNSGSPYLCGRYRLFSLLFIIWNSLWCHSVSQHVDTAPFSLLCSSYLILAGLRNSSCSVFQCFSFLSVCVLSCSLYFVFVWQGTHYWWWLSPLSRLVLRVETLVVLVRMFVFVLPVFLWFLVYLCLCHVFILLCVLSLDWVWLMYWWDTALFYFICIS